MMDQFMEEVVTKRNKGLQTALFILAWVIMLVFAFYAFVSFSALSSFINHSGFDTNFFVALAECLVFAAVAVGIYLYKDRLKTEYEYTLTNHQLDFAQVFNNKKRKALGTMNLRNVEACGLVSSGSFNRYISMQGVKATRWYLNRDAELLYFYYQKDGQKRMIIIEPSEEMIAMIKKGLAQGAWQNN